MTASLTTIQLAEVIPTLIGDIDDEPIAIELIGPSGIGKSDLIRQIVTKLSTRDGYPWGISTLNLGLYTVPDIQGYLAFQHLPDGRMVSRFSEPAYFVCDDGKHCTEYKRWALFADEIGQADAPEKKAFAPMQLEGRAGVHRFPKGTVVFSASNRPKDRSGVTKDFDFRINRRVEFHVLPDFASWKRWANEAGVHPAGIIFAEKRSDIVFAGEHPKEQGPWCTPRSLVKGMMLLTRMGRAVTPGVRYPVLPEGPVAMAVLSGIVGEAAAESFMETLMLTREAPSYEEIVADPKKTRIPDAPDAQMLVALMLAHQVTDDKLTPVITYVDRMEADFATTFVTSVMDRNAAGLLRNPTAMQWISKNKALINLMARR